MDLLTQFFVALVILNLLQIRLGLLHGGIGLLILSLALLQHHLRIPQAYLNGFRVGLGLLHRAVQAAQHDIRLHGLHILHNQHIVLLLRRVNALAQLQQRTVFALQWLQGFGRRFHSCLQSRQILRRCGILFGIVFRPGGVVGFLRLLVAIFREIPLLLLQLGFQILVFGFLLLHRLRRHAAGTLGFVIRHGGLGILHRLLGILQAGFPCLGFRICLSIGQGGFAVHLLCGVVSGLGLRQKIRDLLGGVVAVAAQGALLAAQSGDLRRIIVHHGLSLGHNDLGVLNLIIGGNFGLLGLDIRQFRLDQRQSRLGIGQFREKRLIGILGRISGQRGILLLFADQLQFQIAQGQSGLIQLPGIARFQLHKNIALGHALAHTHRNGFHHAGLLDAHRIALVGFHHAGGPDAGGNGCILGILHRHLGQGVIQDGIGKQRQNQQNQQNDNDGVADPDTAFGCGFSHFHYFLSE